MKRLGLYGGTFDPIHNAHIAVARTAIDTHRLDLMLLIPNRLPPHKESATGATYEQRLEMVRLACEGELRLEACDIENRDGKSYTIQTLESLRTTYGDSVQFFFLIGADAFAEVLTWYRVEDVFQMTDFIVAARPGFKYQTPSGARVHQLDSLAFHESSSEIRSRICAGLGVEFVPPSVARYIAEMGLYKTEKAQIA